MQAQVSIQRSSAVATSKLTLTAEVAAESIRAATRNLLGLSAQVGLQSINARTQYAVVEVGEPLAPPEADFTAAPRTVEKGGQVQFADLSTGVVTAWDWNIGGARYFTRDPLVTFDLNAGTYNVSLRVRNDAGEDTEMRIGYITVTQTMPTANFTSDVTTVEAGGYVQFIDTSTNETSRIWTIDGVQYTEKNPRVQFNTTGAKSVSLQAINANGSNTKTVANYVTVTEAEPPETFQTYRTGVIALFSNNTGSFDTEIRIGCRTTSVVGGINLKMQAFAMDGTALFLGGPMDITLAHSLDVWGSLASDIEELAGQMALLVVWNPSQMDDGTFGELWGETVVMVPLTGEVWYCPPLFIPDHRNDTTSKWRSGQYVDTLQFQGIGWETILLLINGNIWLGGGFYQNLVGNSLYVNNRSLVGRLHDHASHEDIDIGYTSPLLKWLFLPIFVGDAGGLDVPNKSGLLEWNEDPDHLQAGSLLGWSQITDPQYKFTVSLIGPEIKI